MTTIKNINENYGDPIEFTGDDLPDCLYQMAAGIVECGYGEGQNVNDLCCHLREGVDYEIL